MAGCALDLVTDLWILLGPRCLQPREVNEMRKQEHHVAEQKKRQLF